MYNFSNWKEAFDFLINTENVTRNVLQIENKRDTFFLKQAALKYKIAPGADNLFFTYSSDLSVFEFQFSDKSRKAILPGGLAAKIAAIGERDYIDIPFAEGKVESIRALAYKAGYSVVSTETGCRVSKKSETGSLRSDIGTALLSLAEVGDHIDLPCINNLLGIRMYVSQLKEENTSYKIIQIGEKARITKVK